MEIPNIVQNSQGPYRLYSYDVNLKTWQEDWLGFMKSSAFNAIFTTGTGRLYLDLNGNPSPILCLQGFLKPGYNHQVPNPDEYLETDLFDPSYFNSNQSTLEILNNPVLSQIETIRSQNYQNGSWEASSLSLNFILNY